MLMSRQEIAKRINISEATLRVYLCRAEFNKNRTKSSYLFNMEIEELEKLNELIRTRRKRKGDYSLLEEENT